MEAIEAYDVWRILSLKSNGRNVFNFILLFYHFNFFMIYYSSLIFLSNSCAKLLRATTVYDVNMLLNSKCRNKYILIILLI
jgi:hypothetical protein